MPHSQHEEAAATPGAPSTPASPAAPVTLITDNLEKPSLDDRLYRVIRLENDLEALLVQDAETDKASAALDVNVGNFSDEADIPGMAHAVEHLLFMGTKKFPIENEYGQYLSANSGSSNAYTGPTSTNYFFDVSAKPANDKDPSDTNPSPLREALDRFSQFFIEPLFLSSTLDRELKAVDSENKKNLQNDTWRLHQLDKSLSNPKHPYCHFSTGNFEVLKTLPEGRGINVREKFIDFHAKHYSANRMKLVVLGREPLDVLQKWVVELFSPVINKKLEPNRWPDELPFRESDLGTQCFAKPVMDSREINLYFPFIDEEHLFASQPGRYISHLIGHEGPGSIMSYVKSKGWANGLSAGAYPVCAGSLGILGVQVRLTEEGLKHYTEIVKVFFQYIALLRESPPLEWIFQEQKGMADVDFKFKQKTPASRFTSRISSVMQKPLPREWLLSGHSRLRSFEPKQIEEGLAMIRPDNLRLVVVSRTFPGNWDQKEKWYGTEYKYEKIPSDLMAELKKAASVTPEERLSGLHLPHKNNFIPNQLEVEKKEVAEPALAPRIVRNDERARTWWKKDDTFWVPRANVVVSLQNPAIYASAENNVKARLFTDLVRDALEEYAYDAELAGLQYSVSLDSRGLLLDLSGYNDKLPVLLEQVTTTMRDLPIKEDRFNIVKERLTRGYNNWQLQSSYHQVGDYTTWLTAEDRDFIVEELAAELPSVTVEGVRQFQKQMLSQVHVEVYVHGNMYKEDALKVTDMVESTLKPRILPRSQWPILRSLILPPGSNYVFRKTLKDPANVNHCIETWFYLGDKSDRSVRAKTLLLDQMIHEPAFDQLRTKEQLGYIVFSGSRNFWTTSGFRFLLQSEKSPKYLDSRIEAFLSKFSETLANMSDTEFEGHKRSLIVRRLEKLRNLDQESSRHWGQISSEYYDFEITLLDAEHIRGLTKADVVEFFELRLNPASKERSRLSIHLLAQGKASGDEDATKKESDDKEATTSSDEKSAVDLAVEITDVRLFKASLTATSGAQPVKDLSESARLYHSHHDLQGNYRRAWTRPVDPIRPTVSPPGLECLPAESLSRRYLSWIMDPADDLPANNFKKACSNANLSSSPFAVAAVSHAHALDSIPRRDLHCHVTADTFGTLPIDSELPGQLAFTTSSLVKKRKLSRPAPRDQEDPLHIDSPSPDALLPSREVESELDADDDPVLSLSAASFTSVASTLDAPSVARSDSLPASSLPPRLQHQPSSLVSADYASSTASSPCASAYADLSIESDRGGDETGSALKPARSQSPFCIYKRAIMNGDSDIPHRSSSPLKRRASSMDPEADAERSRDVDMGTPLAAETTDSGEQTTQTAQTSSTSLPRAMSVDAPDTNGANGRSTPSQRKPVWGSTCNRTEMANSKITAKPSILEQVKIIETLLKAFAEAPLKEGVEAYLVSRLWVESALALRGDPKDAKKAVSGSPLGPVDNSDIIEETITEANGNQFVRLKPGSGLESFELFPEDAWKMVVDWYGVAEGQGAVVRTAINTATDAASEPNIMYEFHPPVFRVHRLWSELSPLPIEQSLKAKDPAVLVLSRSRKYAGQAFLKDLKKYTGIPVDRKVRLWAVPRTLPAADIPEPRSALTPPDSPGRVEDQSNPQDSWSKLLLDIATFSQVRDVKIQIPLPDQTANASYNGSSSLQLYDLVTDQTIVLDEMIEANTWVSSHTGRSRGSEKAIPTRSTGLTSISASASGRSSPAPQGPLTRGRAQKKSGRHVGAVGLHNLGNTCYMNSALQCVRSVEELTKYFLTDAYFEEVNKSNPLGYNGKIAITYGNLLKEIYMEGKGSVSPRDFKTTVGKCRSTFSGWGQQDSQEFLGFLLDGLQEDLSRIKKKPYIEKPDSTDDMINNPEAIRKMAEKVWDITRLRDDSVIADLFTGMYKSTLKCPVCGKISITFDPFNNLTLPLPISDLWSHKAVKFLPLNDAPVKFEVELQKHSSMEQLMQFLSARTGVPVNRLIGGEEFKDRFFKVYESSQDISEEIQYNDLPTFHELEAAPTNWPMKNQPKKYRSMLDVDTPLEASEWDDPMYERMVVSVFHRKSQAYGRSGDQNPPPHFIVLTRAEASDIDIIRRKVLEKVATFSTWPKLHDPEEVETLDNADAEMIITSVSDADSSGDGKVVANSVEGEDDMIDVSMKDASDRSSTSANQQSQILKEFNTRRPKFINPDGFLDPELQNLFDLSFTVDNGDRAVASGWSSVDHNKTYSKLSDRIPDASTEEDEELSPDSLNGSPSANEDESTNDESSKVELSQTRMMEESSEEDAPLPAKGGRGQQFGPGGRRKFKGPKTYSKKAAKRREKQLRNSKAQKLASVKAQPTPPGVADGGPLIRLGEALVVDWNPDAWDMAFSGGVSGDASKEGGLRTFTDLEVLHDPGLKMSQRTRAQRRTRGITLDECLDEFERAEILSEQDMWYCPRCKEHRRASKKFDLWKTPDILVAHLKRFSSSGYRRDKLDVLVDFPIVGLDLTTRVIQKEEGKEEIYDLIAVDDHYGGLGGGHYTAYARNFEDGKWYNYNDSGVTPVPDPSSAITNAAYLLFYRRRSAGPLGGTRFEEIFDKYRDHESGDDMESGEDQRLGGGSSLNGSSGAGRGAVATRRLADRGSGRTTIRSVNGTDDDEDDLPPYSDAIQGETIHNSIEDEGVEMTDGYQQLGPTSLDLTQGWSFTALDGSRPEDSTGADCASDVVQRGSSFDERGLSQELTDHDTEMSGHVELSDAQNESWEETGVISVPNESESDQDTEVTEIHLEGGKESRRE
ncbi:hypothetical protein G7046_g302 [Stylonectria norvegica]|nr:hypothetical protein G7046_g302 [Stylonectria norvegica]